MRLVASYTAVFVIISFGYCRCILASNTLKNSQKFSTASLATTLPMYLRCILHKLNVSYIATTQPMSPWREEPAYHLYGEVLVANISCFRGPAINFTLTYPADSRCLSPLSSYMQGRNTSKKKKQKQTCKLKAPTLLESADLLL